MLALMQLRISAVVLTAIFISLIRACVANETLKWVGWLCTPGGAVVGIVGGGVTFRFLNGEDILFRL